MDRQPGSVIVNVKPPAAHVASVNQAFQDWQPVASQIISDVQTETPEAVSTPTTRQQPVSTPTTVKQTLAELLQEVDAVMEAKPALSQGQEIILKALRKSTHAQDLESIESMTGLNSLYILLSCREMAELGFVEIVSTLTVRKFRASEVC